MTLMELALPSRPVAPVAFVAFDPIDMAIDGAIDEAIETDGAIDMSEATDMASE